MLLTVGFTVVQFTAVQQPFIAVDIVPQGVGEQSQDRPFAALVLDVKAVAQITGSFSLTWPAPGQPKRTLMAASQFGEIANS